MIEGKRKGTGAGQPLEDDQDDRNGESDEDDGMGEGHGRIFERSTFNAQF